MVCFQPHIPRHKKQYRFLSQIRFTKLLSGLLALSLTAASFSVAMGYAEKPAGESYPGTFSPTLIADIAEAVAPSVVNIDVAKDAPDNSSRSGLPGSFSGVQTLTATARFATNATGAKPETSCCPAGQWLRDDFGNGWYYFNQCPCD
jgi:hypothetical protein